MTQNSVLEGIVAVSITDVEISPLGQTVEFAITAKSDWSIKVTEESWLQLNKKTGGAGTTNIVMTVPENDGEESVRSQTLEIKQNGSNDIETITVTQARPYLRVDKTNITFGWDHYADWGSQPEILQIESNVGWTITDITESHLVSMDANSYASSAYRPMSKSAGFANNQWLIYSDVKTGEGDAQLSFIPSLYNVTAEKHTSVFKITRHTTLNEEFAYIVTLNQENRKFVIYENDDYMDHRIAFDACVDPNESNVEIVVDVEGWNSWSVEPTQWVEISDYNGNIGVAESVFVIPNGANPLATDREDMVIVACNDNEYEVFDTIWVSQKGYIFQLVTSDIEFSNAATNDQSFALNSSGKWSVDTATIPEWLTIETLSGDVNLGQNNMVNNNIRIKTNSQNLDFDDREASIIFQTDEPGNDMVQSMNITQTAYWFNAQIEQKDLLPTSVDLCKLEIESAGAWSIDVDYSNSQDKDWLNLSTTYGSGNADVYYNAKTANLSTDNDRVAQLIISSTTHKEADVDCEPLTFMVVQKKFTFNTEASGSFENLPATIASDATYTIKVNCSGPWTLNVENNTSSDNWITANPSSGNGDAVITITIDTNNADARSADVKLVSTLNELSSPIYKFSQVASE